MKRKYKNLRFATVVVFLMFFTLYGYSQENDDSQHVQQHYNSPEAAQFGRSSNTIDYNAGKLNVGIPLHQYKGREMDLPVTVDYSGDGIRVEQLASSVGLGWNLNLGARITAVVNGTPDLVYTQNYVGGPDYYLFQAPGITEYFKMEYNFPIAQLNPLIKAELRASQNSDWVITMPDGSMYFFEGVRETNTTYKGGPSNSYVYQTSFASSWLATKIVSKNGLDVYQFSYSKYDWADMIKNDGDGQRTTVFPNAIIAKAAYKMDQQLLSAIWHNDQKIISFNYSNRLDLNVQLANDPNITGNKLETMNCYNFKGTPDNKLDDADDAPFYKQIKFSYSYFGNEQSPDVYDKKLKLDKLTFIGLNDAYPSGVKGNTYSFVYDNGQNVPGITSCAQDYLGLYNGMDSNTDLVDVYISSHIRIKRKFDLEKAQYGILKRVIYPGRGYTDFEFEQNTLNGHYEHYYELAHVRTDTVTVAAFGDFQHLGEWIYCEPNPGDDPERFATPHPDMNAMHFELIEAMNLKRLTTTYLEVSGSTEQQFFLETKNPYGVYVIQSLNNLSCPELSENAACIQSPGFTRFSTCLRNTNTINYNENTNTFPEAFILGGTTKSIGIGQSYTESIRLNPGKYQITFWDYADQAPWPYPAYMPSLRIFKKVDVDVPDRLIDIDTPGELTDGIRIKTIKNYSADGVYASGSLLKYGEGQMNHILVNYHPIDNGHHMQTSQGYVYPNPVFYKKVSEIQIDADENKHNGHIEYGFSHIRKPLYEGDETIPQNCLHRHYDRQFFTAYFDFEEDAINNSKLKTKKVFANDGNLLRKEEHVYSFGDYETLIWRYFDSENPGWMPVTRKFSYLPNTYITEYFPERKKIDKSIEYEYNPDSNMPYLPWAKHADGIDTYYNYDFDFNAVNFAGCHLLSRISLTQEEFLYEHAATNSATNLTYKFLTTTESPQNPVVNNYQYDEQNNLVTVIRKTPGNITPASYETTIWGYNHKFPVASLKGLTYATIYAGHAALIDQIKSLSAQPVNQVSESALQAKLSELRAAYPDNFVTTFTYNPVFGMTSKTDAKGATVFYEYDVFGRPTLTKKLDPLTGKQLIISDTKYNTKEQ